MNWWSFQPYVSVAQRRAKAAREVEKLKKKGRAVSPVVIEGRAIATTFWGKAWCDHLESYSDFASRLPRGRSYVKNGAVCDLQVEPGQVAALVCGTEVYRVAIKVAPLSPAAWKAIKSECAGRIGSVIELLQGKLSKAVMEVVTRRDGGLFPRPREIKLDCSCPDWADMCKHVAASLYGVGARLDHQPELLFKLRGVDHLELITEAGAATGAGRRPATRARTIAAGDLADVFGVELEPAGPASESAPTPSPVRPTPKAKVPVRRRDGIDKSAKAPRRARAARKTKASAGD